MAERTVGQAGCSWLGGSCLLRASDSSVRFQLCPLVATVAQLSQPGSLPALTLSLAAADLSICPALPPPPFGSQLCGSGVIEQVMGRRAGGPCLIGIHVRSLHCLFGADKNFRGTFCCVSTTSPSVSPLQPSSASAGPPETPSQGSAHCVPGRSGEPRSASLASHGSATGCVTWAGQSLSLCLVFLSIE